MQAGVFEQKVGGLDAYGKVIELIRDTPISGTHCFRSVKERGEPFETLLNYYERGHARVFSPNRFMAA